MRYLIVLAIMLLFGCSSSRNLSDWTLLGERIVNHTIDHDEIRVGGREGSFSKLKIIVRRRAVNFRDLKVHYGNGAVVDISIRRVVPAGGETHAIDLHGQNRVIEKIVFRYNTDWRRGKRAIVAAFGKH